MVSPARRHDAARFLQHSFRVSERRACKSLGINRSTFRYRPRQSTPKEQALETAMLSLAGTYIRWGYRPVMWCLRENGFKIGETRMRNLWRKYDLHIKPKARKRRRIGISDNAACRRVAEYPDHVWAYDFQYDQLDNGRRIRFLNVVDEYTRECMKIRVGKRMRSAEVITAVDALIQERGAPQFIRSDNGPEFISRALVNWLRTRGVKTLFIKPGSPWENAYVETFNGKMRDELLNLEVFASVTEAQVLAEGYRYTYNELRPHYAHKGKTPAQARARYHVQ